MQPLRKILVNKVVLIITAILVVSGLLYLGYTATQSPKTTPTKAETGRSIKIMTFNILGEPVCSDLYKTKYIPDITNFIKTEGIAVTALQEVISDHNDSDCDVDMQDEIANKMSGSNYSVKIRQYLSTGTRKWYRMFIHTGTSTDYQEYPAGVNSVGDADSQGFESIVVDTEFGPIRFINVHPHGGGVTNFVTNVVNYANQFRNSSDPQTRAIPIIIMGDFNLRYDMYEGVNDLPRLEEAGFVRACNTTECNNTVDGADYAIDHIFLDSRINLRVKSAQVKQDWHFSDHLPVIVELTDEAVTTPTVSITPSGTPNDNAFWQGAKPTATGKHLWDEGGPTASWESYIANRVYICNGKSCWIIDRSNNTTSWLNNGEPFEMDEDASYNTVTAAPNGDKPWSDNGPTAAWTWMVNNNGVFSSLPATEKINETLLCNKNYCWRYARPANGNGLWRDNGSPIYLPTYNEVWSDPRVASLWQGNGITVAWTDPVNSYVTMCNVSDCRSINYETWIWKVVNETSGSTVIPLPEPSGKTITEYTSGWTSPVTNIATLCTGSLCQQFNIQTNQWQAIDYSIDGSVKVTITPSPTVTLNPSITNAQSTPTHSPTPNPTGSNSPTATVTLSSSPSASPSPTASLTPTPTASQTPTPLPPTATATQIPSNTPTLTATAIPPTNTPTLTFTPTATNTPTFTATPVPPTATATVAQSLPNTGITSVEKLQVNNQNPGGPAPWYFIAVPAVILLLGFLL